MNWKYIIGEVLLIFIGINLAIWFNDWNDTNKTTANKEIAIAKIKEEIQNNLKELRAAREINYKIPLAIEEFSQFPRNSEGVIEVNWQTMHSFQENYPNFFKIRDSLPLMDSVVRYNGDSMINLELIELSEIAWETSRNMGIAHEFGYECLYGLESMYNVQQLVQNEVNKAAEALQNQEVNRLLRIFVFMEQLGQQLETDYQAMLNNMDSCL